LHIFHYFIEKKFDNLKTFVEICKNMVYNEKVEEREVL